MHLRALDGASVRTVVAPALPVGDALSLCVRQRRVGLPLVDRDVVDADVLERSPQADPQLTA
eukprot:1992309-Pyramimonas_sp.AAC.1